MFANLTYNYVTGKYTKERVRFQSRYSIIEFDQEGFYHTFDDIYVY